MDPKLLRESLNRINSVVEDDDRDARIAHEMESLRNGIEEMQSIQEEMFELIERLGNAISSYAPDNYEYWKAYGLAQLAVIAGSEEFMSSDESISSLVDDMKDEYHELRDEIGSGEDIG